MIPNCSTEAIRTHQRELAQRAEAARQRREAREWMNTSPRTYPHAMRVAEEATVAARHGLIAEARRLFALAYGSPAGRVRQPAQRP